MARREGYASLAPSARSRFPPQKLCQYFPDGIILRWNYSSAIALPLGLFALQDLDRLEVVQDARVDAGLRTGGHLTAEQRGEALGEVAGLIGQVPVEALRQHETLGRLEPERFDVA